MKSIIVVSSEQSLSIAYISGIATTVLPLMKAGNVAVNKTEIHEPEFRRVDVGSIDSEWDGHSGGHCRIQVEPKPANPRCQLVGQ